ncbi:MAG: hypothetical protein GY822_04020 [Deltaproteobacteria bacterium]|nr:hypothetical protein [Deltaproteobacteria bacterium]
MLLAVAPLPLIVEVSSFVTDYQLVTEAGAGGKVGDFEVKPEREFLPPSAAEY